MLAADWAEELDAEMRKRGIGAGELVSWAMADGTVGGVVVARDVDDDYGRVLVSADHRMAVRFDTERGWVPIDPAEIEVTVS